MSSAVERAKKVVLLDAYCPSHVGNDVLLDSSVELVQRLYPGAEISVHARKRDSFSATHGLVCKQRLFPSPPSNSFLKHVWYIKEVAYIVLQLLNAYTIRLPPYYLSVGSRRETVKDYADADIAISIGGELISDTFWKVLPLHLHMFWLAKQSGASVVIFPQSIGPLRRGWTRRLARFSLSRCDIVTGRDRPAVEELKSLDIDSSRILFSPDVGVGQPMGQAEEARDYLRRIGANLDAAESWIGVTCSAGSPELAVDGRRHIEALANALIRLSGVANIAVVILPANMPVMDTPDTDYSASEYLFSLLRGKLNCIIAPPEVIPARLFKALCGVLDVFVSTRMHAAILSSMAPVPTIAINTQRKLRGYMELIGQSDMCLDMVDVSPETLLQLMELGLSNKSEIMDALHLARHERLAALDDYARELRTRLDVC